MNELFDDRLHRVLQRTNPPEGFRDRVLHRVRTAPAPSPRPSWIRRSWLAAAAALLVAVPAVLLRQHHENLQRVQEEAARAQLLQALQIANEKLNHAFERAQRATRQEQP